LALSLDKKISAARIAFDDCRTRVIILTVKKDKKANSPYFIKKIKSSKLINEGAVVIYDHEIDINDDSVLLWKIFNNVDPLRDIIMEKGCMIIDATKKGIADGHTREWPDDIVMSKDVVKKVDLLLKDKTEFKNE
jgi:4-hydroxy-3-polyprenylbenzoate decarboxylase